MASWITAGAVASAGASVEPCSNINARYPDEEILLRNYTQGQTVIEAIWKSIAQPWKSSAVGDPLAAPFSILGASSTPGCIFTGTFVGSIICN